jgi:DUF4097 and DUF4098 domain-containing protein YvlB
MVRIKFLLSIMIATLLSLSLLSGCKIVGRYERYENAQLYTAGDFTYSAMDVKEVEIDWINGSIEIVQTDGAELSVTETSIKDIHKTFHHYLDGTTLKIKFCESGAKTNVDGQYKNLRVEIPDSIHLEIESVSAPITIGEATLSSLSVETVSGKLTAENVHTPRLEIDSVSADIELGLSAQTIAEIETTSGDITLSLLKNMGATIVYETLSGKFTTEREYGKAGKKRYDILGDANISVCEIEIDTVSGDLFVK